MIYFIIFIIITLLCVTQKEGQCTGNKTIKFLRISENGKIFLSRTKLLVISFTLLLIIFAGTRINVGADYYAYQDSYQKIKNGLMGITSIEPIYLLIAKFTSEYKWFLLVIAALSVSSKIIAISKKSLIPWLSILLYFSCSFVQYDMGIIRQGLAMSFVLLSWVYIDEEKLSPNYYIFYFMAVMFHYSAAISIVAVIIRRKKIPVEFMIIATILACAISQIGLDHIILSFLLKFLPTRIQLVSAYSRFADSASYIRNVFSFTNIRRALLLVFFCYAYKKGRGTLIHSFFLNMYFIGVMLYYLFSSYVIISGRLGMYFCIAEIFLFPLSIKCFTGIAEKLLKFVTVIYCFLLLQNTIGAYTESWMNAPYLPYTSWLFQ